MADKKTTILRIAVSAALIVVPLLVIFVMATVK